MQLPDINNVAVVSFAGSRPLHTSHANIGTQVSSSAGKVALAHPKRGQCCTLTTFDPISDRLEISTDSILIPSLRYGQVLFGAGDVLAQQLVDRVGIENHNYARTARMALYGGGTFYI